MKTYIKTYPINRNRKQAEPRTVKVFAEHLEVSMPNGRWFLIDKIDEWILDRPWYFGGKYVVSWDALEKKTVYLHQFLLKSTSDLVDHKDGDVFNNRRGNLRQASYADNMRNQKLRVDSTSGFKGVRKVYRKWAAQINHGGKQIYLGSASCPKVAAAIYDEAAKKYFGEFARTNKSMGLI